ncbi:hypothetical protein ACIQMO_34870 [Streptomyces sp. NPDC091406]|uniref:hypothetical protein n=1 Tax=unclassified Streptomyces TaxID=2593676 RepID=UPI00381F1A42
MTHEEMLKWLDQANSGAVRGAADRLKSAAEEIHKIAEELKVRPQIVKWRGDGSEAFRTWTANLANETLRLGDYSEGAAKWLTQASHAITHAKTTIPRTIHKGAEANLEAALEARNDPDAAAIARKAEAQIAANDSARHEAAQRMKALSEAYNQSSTEMGRLEKPNFPPPPLAIVPKDERNVDGARSIGPITSGGSSSSSSGEMLGPVSGADGSVTRGGPDVGAIRPPTLASPVVPPVEMGINSVATLPDAPALPSATPVQGQPGGGRSDVGLPPVVGGAPPILNKGVVPLPPTNGSGRPVNAVRPSLAMPGQNGLGGGQVGRPSPANGIVGGRPAPQATGRPVGGLPRGLVVGGEGAHGGRAPMMHAPGGAVGSGQSGIVGGRRLAGEAGGMVGGRPQQPGQTGARPFTPGGTGLVRGAASGEGARSAGVMGRGAVGSQRASDSRRDEGSERPDYLTEDEETWQQGSRRVVPPVID